MKRYIGIKEVEAQPMTAEEAAPKGYRLAKESGDGYEVKYANGYKSWSPKMTFEAAYQSTDAMSFSGALDAMKRGFKLARTGWNGKHMYLEIQNPDEKSKMTLPYIYIKTVQGSLVPWLCSQTDMLADDWGVLA